MKFSYVHKDYRLDKRTFDHFCANLQNHSTEEVDYLLKWLDQHNKKRKKRSIVVIPWGNKEKTIYQDPSFAKTNYRPDFLLARCFDNSFFIKEIFPIEVTTCQDIREEFYIKRSKLDWSYDLITPQIATTKHYILFIAGTKNKGTEIYTFLSPVFIRKLLKRPIVRPSCLGEKPAHKFFKSERNWHNLYNTQRKQQLLLPFEGGTNEG